MANPAFVPALSESEKEWLRLLNNEYRTYFMNQKYYGIRLDSSRRTNDYINLFATIFSSGGAISVVTGWVFLGETWVSTATNMIAVASALATILLIVQKTLNMDGKIEKYSKLFVEYAKLTANTKSLLDIIRCERVISSEIKDEYKRIVSQFSDLQSLDDNRPNKKLLEKVRLEVEASAPHTALFWG